jgi:hypothetical protein
MSRTKEVADHKRRIDQLFAKYKVIERTQDSELQAHWAKYLCLMVSAFLEQAIRSTYSDYAKRKASPRIAKFIQSRLSRFINPSVDKVVQIARSFDEDWANELEDASNQELKDAIVSIVANRNELAHGKHSGITFVTINNYYEKAIKYLEIIERQCS